MCFFLFQQHIFNGAVYHHPKKEENVLPVKCNGTLSTPGIEGVWDQSSGNIYSHLPMFTVLNAKFYN